METLHAGCKTSLWQQREEQLSDHVFDKKTLQRFLGALRGTSVEKRAKFWTYLSMSVRHFKEILPMLGLIWGDRLATSRADQK